MPWLGLALFSLAIITYVPEISLWLPRQLYPEIRSKTWSAATKYTHCFNQKPPVALDDSHDFSSHHMGACGQEICSQPDIYCRQWEPRPAIAAVLRVKSSIFVISCALKGPLARFSVMTREEARAPSAFPKAE